MNNGKWFIEELKDEIVNTKHPGRMILAATIAVVGIISFVNWLSSDPETKGEAASNK